MELVKKGIRWALYKGLFNILSDKAYIKLMFWSRMNYKLNLKSSKTYNEKLQWLKLYDRKPEYTTMVDKATAKSYAASIIGKNYIIPTIGVWNYFDGINFEQFPDRFVLKCTHNSGDVIICKDKKSFNKENAKKILTTTLSKNYYLTSREWPYKNVQPQIIAEGFIGDNEVPDDYKFFVFDGIVDSVMVCKEREKGHPWFYFFDRDWKRLYYQHAALEKDSDIPRPENLDEMWKVAEMLGAGFKQVRIDLYYCQGKVYFGEITLFNQSGFDTDITYETDLMWGNKIHF